MKRSIMASLLCMMFTVMLFDTLLAQDTRQRRRPRMMSPWRGPEIGSVVDDFELKTYEGKVFKLSEQRGKIVVLEIGACT